MKIRHFVVGMDLNELLAFSSEQFEKDLKERCSELRGKKILSINYQVKLFHNDRVQLTAEVTLDEDITEEELEKNGKCTSMRMGKGSVDFVNKMVILKNTMALFYHYNDKKYVVSYETWTYPQTNVFYKKLIEIKEITD